MDVDLKSITPQGRRRLEQARMSAAQRVVTTAGPRVLGEAWKLIAVVVGAVLAAAVILYLRLK